MKRKMSFFLLFLRSVSSLLRLIFIVQTAIDKRNAVENQTTSPFTNEAMPTLGKFGSPGLAGQSDIHLSATANRSIRMQTAFSQENNTRTFGGISGYSCLRHNHPLDVTAYRLVCFGVPGDHEKPACFGY